MDRMKLSIALFVSAFSTASARTLNGATISRQQVIARIQGATKLSDGIPKTPQGGRDALLNRIHALIESRSQEILPLSLEGVSEESINRIVGMPLLVDFADDPYVDLEIKLHLSLIKTYLAYEIKCPPLDTTHRNAVRASLKPLINGVSSDMHLCLVGASPLFEKADVDMAAGTFAAALDGPIDDPDSFWLKLPLKAEDSDKLLNDFGSRLKDSVGRIKARLDEEAPIGENGKRNPVKEQFARGIILQEVTTPLIRKVHALTTDQVRKIDVSKDVAPSLHQMEDQLFQLREKLVASAEK